MNLDEIKSILKGYPDEQLLSEIKADTRAGAVKLVVAYEKRLQREQRERERYQKMCVFENACNVEGHKLIAGVDEAGRGPLAGPLVIAAVILQTDVFISGLNDSKQLTAKKRESLYDEVIKNALAVAVNIVSVSNIDKDNIYKATQDGMQEVLLQLTPQPTVALVDAMPLHLTTMQTKSIIHGDAVSVSIAAASIIAKVTRDRLMCELAKQYPMYDWQKNKGYGSAEHMQAIADCGATIWHRRSYEPVKSMQLAAVDNTENQLINLVKNGYAD